MFCCCTRKDNRFKYQPLRVIQIDIQKEIKKNNNTKEIKKNQLPPLPESDEDTEDE
jgi:hypothetical protein